MVTEIDRMGRINLSRRAVLNRLSDESGAQVGAEPGESPNYPFRSSSAPRETRPYDD